MLPRAALRVFRCFSRRNLTPSSHLYANQAPAPQIWCRHWTDGTPKPALSSYDRFVLKITRTVKGEIPNEARYVAEGLQNYVTLQQVGLVFFCFFFANVSTCQCLSHGAESYPSVRKKLYVVNRVLQCSVNRVLYSCIKWNSPF